MMLSTVDKKSAPGGALCVGMWGRGYFASLVVVAEPSAFTARSM